MSDLIRDNPRMHSWEDSGIRRGGVKILTFLEEEHSIGAWGKGLGVAYGCSRADAAQRLARLIGTDGWAPS